MTAACGGGTSAPNFGAAAVVDISVGLAGLRLAALGMPWAVPLVALVSLAPLTLSTFCATDPPAMPVFTSAESNALLKFQFGSPDFGTGLTKFTNLLLNIAWTDFCQCTSGAFTPFVFPTTPPAGTPIIQLPAIGLGAACETSGPNTSGPGSNPGTFNFVGSTVFDKPNPLVHRMTFQLDAAALATWGFSNPQAYYLSGGIPTTKINMPQVAADTWQIILQDPLNTQRFMVDGTTANTSATGHFIWTLDTYCNVSLVSGTTQLQCCPPDPATQAQLNAILKLVTLQQRQLIPFAYIAGTVHAGLTGASSFAVQGLVGTKLNVTAYPILNKVLLGEPNYIYDLGWMSIETADGFIEERRITNTTQVWTPRLMSEATRFGYSLRTGVTATITELSREP